jgi:CRISPR-associated protein Csd2
MTTVDRRYDFVLLFDVQDGNPNGDPDAGNLPRTDPQSLQGFVTDVCIKRKIRNTVAALTGEKAGNALFFQTQDAVYEKRILNNLIEGAFDGAGIDKKAFKEKKGTDKVSDSEKAKKWLLANYYDIRTFGAVLSTGDFNCGQVRGPAQITFARSLDPIIPLESAITRKSVTTVADAEKQTKNDGFITGTMGRKATVPYALYRGHGFINPLLAKDTGFTFADLAIFFQAIQRMFDLDRSASRGLMSIRGLHVFQHASALGEAPAHVLFDKVVTKSLGREAAPRSFEDYKALIEVQASLPDGIAYRDLTSTKITPEMFPWS